MTSLLPIRPRCGGTGSRQFAAEHPAPKRTSHSSPAAPVNVMGGTHLYAASWGNWAGPLPLDCGEMGGAFHVAQEKSPGPLQIAEQGWRLHLRDFPDALVFSRTLVLAVAGGHSPFQYEECSYVESR